MSGLIMVTGATGELGSQVVELLLDRVPGDRLAALARDPGKLASFAERGVSVRQGDYQGPESLRQAFSGVEKLLLVSATAFSDVKTQHRNVIDAAKQAGVRHIHYTAIQRRPDSTFEIPQVTDWDHDTESALTNSGLEVTLLRNSQYLESLDQLIGEVPADGVIRVPAGHTPTALATRRDMAEATAAVLATDGHAGRTYTLAGSRSFTLNDVAAVLGDLGGTRVSYQDTPLEDYVAARIKAGMPEPFAWFTGAWFQAIAAGEFSATNDIEALIGRPSTPIRAYLTEQRAA